MYKYKPDFDRVKEYFRAFWAREAMDRPLLAVTAPKNDRAVPVPYLAGARDGNFADALLKYRSYAENTYFAGEALPAFECSFGPDQYAAFFGGQITFGKDTSWVEPFLPDIGEDLLLDRSETGLLNRLLAFIAKGAELSGGDFLISMIDLHSNIDALSAARGTQNFLFDLYDSEEAVIRQTQNMLRVYDEIVDSVAAAGRMQERGYIGWAPTYSEEKFAVVQCDVSCMMSPEMVRKFAIPAIEYEAGHLKHCVYHYDGKGALGHLDDILAIPEIEIIQWVPGSGEPRTIEWMDLLHKIQKAGKGLWIYDWTPGEIVARCRELDPAGLLFSVSTASPKEADDLIKAVKKLY